MNIGGNISTKIYVMSAVNGALIALLLLFLGNNISNISAISEQQIEVTEQQRVIITEQGGAIKTQAKELEKLALANQAFQLFSDLRYWLYDLQVSWLNESEDNANGTKEQLLPLLAQLAQNQSQEGGDLAQLVEEFNVTMLEAVDAYVDNNRVLGNSLVAKARGHGSDIESILMNIINESKLSSEQSSQTVLGNAATVLKSADNVGEFAHNINDNSSKLTLAFWITLVIILLSIGVFSFLLIKHTVTPINNLQTSIQDIEKESNLCLQINTQGNDEIAATAQAFSRMISKFRDTLLEFRDAVSEVEAAANKSESAMTATTTGIAQQHADTDQVATAMTQMATTVQHVADNAKEASTFANNASDEALNSQSVVTESTEGIKKLAKEIREAQDVVNSVAAESDNIGKMLDVIRGVSEQTNLLALNAAIEAARAGEAGRGFAVVADEVRTLAQRTQQSTQDIQHTIERLNSGTQLAVETMERSADSAQQSVEHAEKSVASLQVILSAVNKISDLNAVIADSAAEQNSVTASINESIINIKNVTGKTSSAAENTMDAVTQLIALSQKLDLLIKQFKL